MASPRSKTEDFADEVAQSTKARSFVQSSMTFGQEADLSGTEIRMLFTKNDKMMLTLMAKSEAPRSNYTLVKALKLRGRERKALVKRIE